MATDCDPVNPQDSDGVSDSDGVCEHTKVTFSVDGGDDVIICPICDDVDFETIGDSTGVVR